MTSVSNNNCFHNIKHLARYQKMVRYNLYYYKLSRAACIIKNPFGVSASPGVTAGTKICKIFNNSNFPDKGL